jgi:hypothetical protein
LLLLGVGSLTNKVFAALRSITWKAWRHSF